MQREYYYKYRIWINNELVVQIKAKCCYSGGVLCPEGDLYFTNIRHIYLTDGILSVCSNNCISDDSLSNALWVSEQEIVKLSFEALTT